MTPDVRGRIPLATAEVAAFLSITPSAVRQIVRRNDIAAAGMMGRAKTYWLHEVAEAVGAHDRSLMRKRRPLCHTYDRDTCALKE